MSILNTMALALVAKRALDAEVSIQKSLDEWLKTKGGFYEVEVRPFLPEISKVVVAGLLKDGIQLS
jgi:hypothetical protein